VITAGVVENNKSSWIDGAHFLVEFPDNNTWLPWKGFMRSVVQAGIGVGLNKYFRVGMSMQHIIFSTCEKERS
jgi:hypothetical protein